jgi:hypothetical protein
MSENVKIESVARRALACPRWRWMTGMSVAAPDTLEGGTGYYRIFIASHEPEEDAYPNFSDPATLGCLLTLVREAWHSPSLHTRLSVEGWEVRDTYGTVIDGKPTTVVCGLDWETRGCAINPNGPHASEVEALVVALEAANGY